MPFPPETAQESVLDQVRAYSTASVERCGLPAAGGRRGLLHGAIGMAVAVLVSANLWAQTPAAQVMGPTRPQTIPLSGRGMQTPAVVVTQQTAPASAPGDVNVLNTTVMVQGPYAGGVPSGKLEPGTLDLTLEAALKMALRNNLGRLTQDAGVMQAEGQRLAARSALLPNLNIGAAEVFSKENLRTAGLKTSIIPASVVFNYDDLRMVMQQTVLDLVSLHQLHGATEALKSTQFQARNARDLIVLAVGGSYLQLTATRARLAAIQARVEYDKSVFDRARDQYSAGWLQSWMRRAPRCSWRPRSSAASACRRMWRHNGCAWRG